MLTAMSLTAALFLGALGTQAGAQQVEVALFLPSAKLAGSPSSIVIRRGDDVVAQIPIERPAAVDLPRSAEVGDVLDCVGALVWCPSVVVAEKERLQLTVFERASIVGRVVYEGELPQSVTVAGVLRAGTGDAEPIAQFEIAAKVADDGSFAFDGPRALADLRITAGSFTATYVWDVDFAKRQRLGTIELVTGSSISGFVVDEKTGNPAESVALTALPTESADSDTEALRRREIAHSAESNGRGFFQLKGLAPGRYRIEASDGGQTAFGSRDLITVEAESDVVLRAAIAMRALVPLRIMLSPHSDENGSPWLVSLRRRQSGAEPGQRVATADALGFAELARMRSGDYDVFVLSQTDDVRYRGKVSIPDTTRLEIDMDLVIVEGHVLVNGDPLESTVEIYAGKGDRTRLETDPEGVFLGMIPRPSHGVAFVTVEAFNRSFERRRTLKVPKNRDRVELELDFEGVDVAGRVETEQGETVSRARVSAFAGSERLGSARTDGRGRFVIPAVPPGAAWAVAAHSRHGDSEAHDFQVVKGRDPNLTLVLRDRLEVFGEVRSAYDSPVANAEVIVVGLGGSAASSRVVKTDANGRFSAKVGGGSTYAVIQVFAPGFGITSQCVQLEASRPAIVRLGGVPDTTLTVDLVATATEEAPAASGAMVLFSDSGAYYMYPDLSRWHRLQGLEEPFSPHENFDRIQVRGLPANQRYAAVWTTETRTAVLGAISCGYAPMPAGLEWVDLPPLGAATLVVDLEPGS